MPSRSHACMRLRPAFSPAGDAVASTRAGSRRRAGPPAPGPCAARRGSRGAAAAVQARQNGVKTAYGFGLPMSATKLPGVRRGSTPASRSAASTRWSRAHRERRDVGGEVDRASRRARGPASAARARACRARRRGCRRAPAAPRAARCRHSSRNAVAARRRGGRAAARRRARTPGTTRSQRVERRAQRRVVVHAQVAPEPDERGGHRPVGTDARPRLDRRGAGPGLPAVPARASSPCRASWSRCTSSRSATRR